MFNFKGIRGIYKLAYWGYNQTCYYTSADSIDLNCTIKTSQTNIPCYGNQNGKIIVTATGFPPFTYYYDGIVSLLNQKNNFAAGTHAVKVMDAMGGIDSLIVTNTSPSPILSSHQIQNTFCVACANGSITINAGGGVPPYTYTRFPLYGTIDANTISNLPSCILYVCVADSNNCSICIHDTILENPLSILGKDRELLDVEVFPNLFSEYTMIYVDQKIVNAKSTFVLTDALGKMVKELSIDKTETIFLRKDLAVGTYFYKIISNGEFVKTGLLVVEN
ncbi:MAG: T9SS type A sorting domain-containing protein [Bacteroidetes bacterium]|nr:T9SS type A sorting domain-containing protein [Bacteroidota bacterium]